MPRRIVSKAGFLWGVTLAVGAGCSAGAPSDSPRSDEDAVSWKHCGNGVCSGNESCASCPTDCGACSSDAGVPDAQPPPDAGSDGAPASSGVGPQASITCPAGAMNIAIGDDVPSIVDAAPGGTTFCVLAGIHSPTRPINLKTGDALVGQFGAIIDGANVTQSYDIGSISIVRGWNCGFTGTPCADVTVQNLVVRNLPGHNCIGVFEDGSTTPGTGWHVDHNEVYGCNMGGGAWSNGSTTYNYFHDNGCGTGGYLVSHGVIDHNEIAFNHNSGCKWAGGDNLTITNNDVHDNACPACTNGMNVGLWLDTVGAGNLIQGNRVRGQDVGIMYEATDYGRITQNDVANNPSIGIYVSNSNTVEVDHNTLTQPLGSALNLFEDPSTGYTIHDVYFHDNTVDLKGHPDVPAVGLGCSNTTTCGEDYGGSKNNRFDYNTYDTGGLTSYGLWLWGANALTWSRWQAIPEDVHGAAF